MSRALVWILIACGLAACGRSPAAPDAGSGTDASSLDGSSADASSIDAPSRPDAPRDAALADVVIPDAPTLDEYAAIYADLYCDLAYRCQATFAFFDPSTTCAAASYARDTYAAYAPAIDEGRAAYDAMAAAACLRGLAGGCAAASMALDVCAEVVVGRVPDGSSCRSIIDCAPSSYCSDAVPCEAPGTCAPRPRVGEACPAGTTCALDSYCSSGTCVAYPRAALGEPCDGVTTSCLSWLDCRSGVCANPSIAGWPGLGEACDRDACATGFICSSGVCVARGRVGEPCAPTRFLSCEPGAGCRGATCEGLTCTGGTCEALGDAGDACGAGNPGCALPSVCVGGVCIERRGLGEACTVADECISARCDLGTCASCL